MDEQKGQKPPAPENRTPGNPQAYLAPTARFDDQDDLTLAGVWRVLRRRWKVVLTVPIFTMIAAAGYLLVATPRYEAEVVLLPPEPHHVEALNIKGINQVTSSQLYDIFVRNLRSHSLRRRFFDENGLFSVLGDANSGSEQRVFEERFSELLKVREGTRDQKDFVYVTLLNESPDLVTTWLNDFVQLTVTSTVEEIVGGATRRIGNQRDKLREHIRIAREAAQQRREDRIATLAERIAVLRDEQRRRDRLVVLDEQIAIARELNIMDRNDALARLMKEQSVGLSVTTAPEPAYLRGVNELVAEREAVEKREDDDPFLSGLREVVAEMEVLKVRTNDDPFIPGLRDKEEQIAQLEAGLAQLRESTSGILPARIDRRAIVPERPASPRKMRILAMSLVAGLLLGVFAAFQANALES